MGISRKNIRNKETHKNTHNYAKMFFNYPTMFETPMFYQPRSTYYHRRPRTAFRRPQPERTFNFSPFMSELDDIYGYPVRQQTKENDCNCENCRNNIQKQAKKLEPESESEILEPEKFPESPKQETEISEPKKLPDSSEQQKVSENEEDLESENSESENKEKIEDSKYYNAIIEIAKQSEAIQKDLENTDWDCLDEKQKMKKLRYAAENQYKLIEKLDLIHSDNTEERNLRKITVKSIQKRLDSIDSILN